MKIAWFSAGAIFRTYQGQQTGKTDNRIAYSVGRPDNFKEIYKSSVPTWTNHWRYNRDTDVVLDKPDDYTIECESRPENVFFEMTIPSG